MSQNNPLLNKKYQALFSQYCDRRKRSGLFIRDLILVPLFPENFLLVRARTPLRYFPPDRQEMVTHVIRTLEYQNKVFGLIVFET